MQSPTYVFRQNKTSHIMLSSCKNASTFERSTPPNALSEGHPRVLSAYSPSRSQAHGALTRLLTNASSDALARANLKSDELSTTFWPMPSKSDELMRRPAETSVKTYELNTTLSAAPWADAVGETYVLFVIIWFCFRRRASHLITLW